jgi:trans-aconitate 2-methyltransferase
VADWDAQNYLRFGDERTRPVHDLLAHVPSVEPAYVYDLGCGPGNSTQVLHERFPQARLIGVDSSPDMLAKAKAKLPNIAFIKADLANFTPDRQADLCFANAVLQWLPDPVSIMQQWLGALTKSGVLAVQMPDNLSEPSHALMHEIAARDTWAEKLAPANLMRRPLDSPGIYYDRLKPLCSHVEIWHIVYNHVLAGPDALIEWVSSTGLRPYLDLLEPEETQGFLAVYRAALAQAYPVRIDGKLLFRFPRLFIVAVKS